MDRREKMVGTFGDWKAWRRLKWRYRSQSRMRGDYLFYEEKVETTQDEKDAKAARRYVSLPSVQMP